MVERRRIYACGCEKENCRRCDPEFTWYEPQDIIKGRKLAKEIPGLEGNWFVAYKLCHMCKYGLCELDPWKRRI